MTTWIRGHHKDEECQDVFVARGTRLSSVAFAAPWWDRFPERASTEIDLMQRNTNASSSIQDGLFVWNETVSSNYGSRFDIAIVHQRNHPFDVPRAYVLFPMIEPSLRYHMFNDGHLCLSSPGELGSSTTALTVRNLACMWVTAYETYKRTGKWITREH